MDVSCHFRTVRSGAYLNLGGPFSFGYDKPFAVEFLGEFPKGSSNTS